MDHIPGLVRLVWIASCPTCGCQLTTARTQQRGEQRAALGYSSSSESSESSPPGV